MTVPLDCFSLNGENHCKSRGRAGKSCCSGPSARGAGRGGGRGRGLCGMGCEKPFTVKATRPVGCAEGRGLGIICGSLLSSSPHLSQALQKPLDNVFFPSLPALPTPPSPKKTDAEDMVLWKEQEAGSQETGSYSPKSAHFLVGSDSEVTVLSVE